MPEEKKEKFTFSDKIKSSKAAASKPADSPTDKPAAKPAAKMAGSKSFAKSSSRIGKDGKPKQTLFERTRRDAPFFIAALVALLLLPFLYKYSGQSSEEELLVPVSEENIFNPDHFGFNTVFTEDPDGQIAQLSGRDSLSLIRGLGSGEEDYGRDDLDFDASSAAAADYDYKSDAEGKYEAARHESSDMDIENNTTNIYKRRAKRGTRAAFKRAATKIGSLNPATMRRGGGSPLGVKNWGGGIKQAAQKVKPTAPKEGPKPVSLQPLRAKSGRAAFGGTGTAGRKSRDAMGKADAQAALRDANVKPVDPTRVGGLDMFSMGPGGGGGKLERHINIGKGQEPWWWDMMKTRMQKEWEKRFERKWKWIDWADQIAMNILKGLINCLITGNSDGDVDNFLGKFGTNSSVEPTCCGKGKKKIGALIQQQTGLPFGKEGCQNYQTFVGKDKCPDGWKDHSNGGGAEVNMGFVGQRLCCMGFCGAGFKGSAAGSIDEGHGLPCADISNHRYHLNTYKLPRKWQKHTYIYVVARNYRPANYPALDERAERGFLCARDGIFNIGGKASAGVDDVEVAALRDEKDEPNNFYKAHRHSVSHTKEQKTVADMYDLNREDVHDGCVIYIQRGNTFNYDNFQANMVQAFKKVLKDKGVDGAEAEKQARNSFNNLDLMFIEGFASQYKLAYAQWFETGNNLHEILPMVYWRFYDTFVEHRGSTHKASGSRTNVDKRKMRVWGGDSGMGDRCYFEDSLTAECMEQEKPQVIVHFNPRRYHGGELGENLNVVQEAENIAVTAKFIPLNADEKFVGTEQPLDIKDPVLTNDGKGLIYTFTDVVKTDRTGKEVLEKQIGNIVWSVDRKGNSDTQHMLTVTCPFNLSGDAVQSSLPETQTGCEPGTTEEAFRTTAAGKQCKQIRTCKPDRTWGSYKDDPNDANCKEEAATPPTKPQETLVSFFQKVGKVPCDKEIMMGARRQENAKEGCLRWQGCKLTVDNQRLFELDEETIAYVAAAKKKFDEANKDANIKLSYNQESLTVANLVDAIMIDPMNGRVPKNTVCLLGKTIGANARDPQAKQFDNMFGVFFAFFGYDAASFPSKWTTNCETGQTVSNLRFRCKSQYWWGGYVNNGQRSGYKREVDNGPWKGFPLAELLRGNFPTKNGLDLVQVNDEQSRIDFHRIYADLEVKRPCQYPKGETMSQVNVLKYIQALCDNGEQIKPKAWKPCPGNSDPKRRGPHGKKDTRDCPDGNC